jgi:hypothetical protein
MHRTQRSETVRPATYNLQECDGVMLHCQEYLAAHPELATNGKADVLIVKFTKETDVATAGVPPTRPP